MFNVFVAVSDVKLWFTFTACACCSTLYCHVSSFIIVMKLFVLPYLPVLRSTNIFKTVVLMVKDFHCIYKCAIEYESITHTKQKAKCFAAA